MESKRSGIFRGGNRSRQDKDGRREGERCFGLADIKVCEECAEVLGIGELLSSIEGFVFIARPLYDLVKKDQKWNWMEKQKEAFKELKKRFTKEPVLAAPDLDKKIRMEVDASDYATGGVLLMECEDVL